MAEAPSTICSYQANARKYSTYLPSSLLTLIKRYLWLVPPRPFTGPDARATSRWSNRSTLGLAMDLLGLDNRMSDQHVSGYILPQGDVRAENFASKAA